MTESWFTTLSLAPDDRRQWEVYSNPETRQLVATVANGPGAKERARLIAAAPSLLDSVKKALDFIQSLPYEPSNTTSTKAQDALMDAIAKAEGR